MALISNWTERSTILEGIMPVFSYQTSAKRETEFTSSNDQLIKSKTFIFF